MIAERTGDFMQKGTQTWELGVIKRAEIETEPVLTFWLGIDFGGSSQGFGGLALDTWSPADKRRVGTAGGADALSGIMAVMGASRWSQLVGKPVWAIRDDNRGSDIIGIARHRAAITDGTRASTWFVAEWQARWFPKS